MDVYNRIEKLYKIYKVWQVWLKYEKIIKISEKYKIRKISEKYKKVRKVSVNNKQLKNISKKKRKGNKIINETRDTQGYFKTTFLEIKETDHDEFFAHTRMTCSVFKCLLTLLNEKLTKTSIRKPIEPELRLSLTLLYLSQGLSFQSLACNWKLGKETVRNIIYETCDAIWNALSPVYVSEPNVTELENVANDFYEILNLPNCIGAIGGKHITIAQSSRSSKKLCSIVLIAACDANYTFTYIDLGTYGSQNDGGIFQLSSFGQRIFGNKLDIPAPTHLPNSDIVLPHFFVADAAFPLHKNIMKPYPEVNYSSPSPEKVYYNQKISRAHNLIENSFGILVSRWRILSTTLNILPDNAEKIILACIALHNFLRLNDEAKNLYIPQYYADWTDENNDIHDGLWRNEISNGLNSIRPSQNAHTYLRNFSTNIRNELCCFLNKNCIKYV